MKHYPTIRRGTDREPPTLLSPARNLIAGELYIFHEHEHDPACPLTDSLQGLFDRYEDEVFYLEAATLDSRTFRSWIPLPETYRYCRRSTRRELREYMCALAFYHHERCGRQNLNNL